MVRVGRICGGEELCSSQMTEWRKLPDAGVLDGKAAGAKVGRLSAEQAEIARLRSQLGRAERRLARTEVALDIMGKAHALRRRLARHLAWVRPELVATGPGRCSAGTSPRCAARSRPATTTPT